MSNLQVGYISGGSPNNNTIRIPSGQLLMLEGNLQVPIWTTASRPASPNIGFVGYNSTLGIFEIYKGSTDGWVSAGASAAPDGSSISKAATSGLQLKTDYPSKTNGLYWIKSSLMPNALQMYVDMVEDGGGYDFYNITGGPSVSYITETHGGTSLGLPLWEGRSPGCWLAASKAVAYFDNANFSSYWQGCGHVYKPAGGGNYTGCIMRSSYYGGNNCGDWRVASGQRWWIRNTTHSEPNGDYNGNGFLRIYGGQIGNPFDVNTNMGFNDGGAYAIGNRYLVSTNTKT